MCLDNFLLKKIYIKKIFLLLVQGMEPWWAFTIWYMFDIKYNNLDLCLYPLLDIIKLELFYIFWLVFIVLFHVREV